MSDRIEEIQKRWDELNEVLLPCKDAEDNVWFLLQQVPYLLAQLAEAQEQFSRSTVSWKAVGDMQNDEIRELANQLHETQAENARQDGIIHALEQDWGKTCNELDQTRRDLDVSRTDEARLRELIRIMRDFIGFEWPYMSPEHKAEIEAAMKQEPAPCSTPGE